MNSSRISASKRFDFSEEIWGTSVINETSVHRILAIYGEEINFVDLTTDGNETNLCIFDHSAVIKSLVSYCENIQQLTVSSKFTNKACEDELKHLFLKNKNLNYLKAGYNMNCKSLLLLPVESFRELILEQILDVDSHDLAMAIRRVENLTMLKFNFFKVSDGVKVLIRYMPSLKIVHLNNDLYINEPRRVIIEWPNLVELNLNDNYSVDDLYLKAIVACCKKLESVSFGPTYRLSDLTLYELSSLPNLTYLRMIQAHNVTDEPLGSFRNLKILICTGCVKLKNDGFYGLLENSEQIEEISIINCANVTSDVIEAVEEVNTEKSKKIILKFF